MCSKQVSLIKRLQTKKSYSAVIPCQLTFVSALHIIYFPSVLVEFDMDSPLLFSHTPVCSKVLLRRESKILWNFGRLSEVLGVRSLQSTVPVKMDSEEKFSNRSASDSCKY